MDLKKVFYVYMIESLSGKLYTGIAKNIDKRFFEHATDLKKGAKFFRTDPPVKVVYKEVCPNRSVASKREAAIKKLSRLEKLKLIVE